MLFKGAFSRGDPAGEHDLLFLLDDAWIVSPLSRAADIGLHTSRYLFRSNSVVMMSGLCAGGGFFNPFNLEIKQIANTNVLHWAGRTFALHEVTTPPHWSCKVCICCSIVIE